MELPSGRAVIGGTLVLAAAVGFEFGWAWLFLTALVLFLGWVGYLVLGPTDS